VKPIARRDFLRSSALGLAALSARSSALRGDAPEEAARVSAPGPRAAGKASLRGLVVDAARTPEKPAYYRRLIDFSREWEMNALLLRLTDDQGCALRFRSHPELITHMHALTPEEARDLARYGEQQGVMVIPEVESFGHTRYITGVPQYAHLSDRDPSGRENFSGLIPVDPESLDLMGDLYREVAALFPSPYLHGGCDEVNWGGSDVSRKALQSKSRAQIWAEYLNSLDEVCRGLGKELIVWGDFVLHKEAEILPRLSKRVIVMDWQYYVTEPEPLARAASQAIAQGLRVIGAPAIITCEWGPRMGQLQLQNLDAYADAYSGLHDSRCLGVVVTNWLPSRYLQSSLWDSFVYAAVALRDGSAAAHQSAWKSFVEIYYAAAWDSNWKEIFATYYRITPNRHSCAPNWPGPRLPVPWASEADLGFALGSSAGEPSLFTELRSRILEAEPSVRRNWEDFTSFALSAEYLDYAFWRNHVVRGAAQAPDAHYATQLIETIAARDRALLEKLDAEWDRGRFSDSPAKLQAQFDMNPPDQLLFRMRQAAEYSAALAADPDRFSRLLGV
jgi:Glycosyl hydrolase family 20, catalytic domain